MQFLALVCLSVLVVLVNCGTPPTNGTDSTRFNVNCPSNLTTFDNDTLQFTYTPMANETVEVSFVYDPSGCTGNLSSITVATGTVAGNVAGSCAGQVLNNPNKRYIYVAMQYGNVFQSSDHVYGLYCEYSSTQKILNKNFTIANPEAFVNTDNLTEAMNNMVGSENFSVEVYDNTSTLTSGTVILGDPILLRINMDTNITFQGFKIQSITAKSGDDSMTYNMTENGCQTTTASSDGIMAQVDGTSNSFSARVKETMAFQAFRFMNQQSVKFDIVVSLCLGVNDAACMTGPACSGSSGRRRREASSGSRVARQSGVPQTGTLETVMYVVGRDESGRTVLVPVTGKGAGSGSNEDKTETARGGDACVTTLHLAIIGALALFLIVVVVVVFAVVLRRRQHVTKKDAGFGAKHQ